MKKVIYYYFAIGLTLFFFWGFMSGFIPNASASCIVNEDWPDAPCLDTIGNGRYNQEEVDMWTGYYSYKGSQFMEEKYIQLNEAIKEDRLEKWAEESTENRNVYEYYFFSGRAPNTGEYRGQFDVIKINEGVVPEQVGEFKTIYEKDRGEGLTRQECEKRFALVQTHFVPDTHLAKFKAENHPAFKSFVKDKSWSFLSDGGFDVRFSENCNEDIAAFGLNYGTDITENSHTLIAVHMDYVSYDVHEIIVQAVDYAPYTQENSQPLNLVVRNWKEIDVLGEYIASSPPIPPQMFRFPYLVNGGTVNEITGESGKITVDLSAKENASAIFAFKLPRNYPYTDHDDKAAGHLGHGPEIFPISADKGELPLNIVKSNCFYDVWLQFSGNTTIEFPLQIGYLQGWAFRGDYDVPEYCNGYSIANENWKKISELSPLKQVKQGINPFHVVCKSSMILVVNSAEKPACVKDVTARALFYRGWADVSTDIYTKFATYELLDEFQSSLIDEKAAIESVKNRLQETSLVLEPEIKKSDLTIRAELVYTLLSKGYRSLLDVDYDTGLPKSTMPPNWESYYRSPNWYTELQKDYLGLSNHRVEEGDLYWSVSYRTCLDCIAAYPNFFVNPVSGEVERTSHLDSLFVPQYNTN